MQVDSSYQLARHVTAFVAQKLWSRLRWMLFVAFAGSIAVFPASCHSSGGQYVWVQQLPKQERRPVIERLGAGDRIYLLVEEQEQLSGESQLSEEGDYLHPLLGKVRIAGLTPEVAARVLQAKLRGIVVNPRVSVAVVSRPLEVSVLGEVTKPGHYQLSQNEGVLGALARAGGLTEFADAESIFVVRRTPAPQRIRFRYIDLARAEQASINFELSNGDVIVVE